MNNQNQQTQTQEQVKLEDLDIFSLLKLEHLTPEQKAERIAEMEEIVLYNFLQEDLPTLVSEEELKEFAAMAQTPAKAGKLQGWLRQKVPGFEKIMLAKALAAKKEFIKQNMLTRLDVASLGLSDPEIQKDEKKTQEFKEQKEALGKIISAIDSDDWATASSLITSL